MPAAKSSSGGFGDASGARGSRPAAHGKTSKASAGSGRRKAAGHDGGISAGLSSRAEQVTNGVPGPLGLVVLTSERIQEVLDDAAERGRVTRSDANELASQLISRGRQQREYERRHANRKSVLEAIGKSLAPR